MSDANQGSKRKLVIKIIIPVLIVCIVMTIWILKNSQKSNATVSGNPDFALLVTDEIDLDQLKSYGIPILLDFGSDSCVPCQELAPVIEELNQELQGKAIVRYLDVWKYPALAQNYPITVIPTQLFIDAKGNPYVPEDANAIALHMFATKDTNVHIFTTHEGGLTKNEFLSILKEMGMKE
ncbi:MAG TPA: thioredoxin family protein [Bacillota bacterium]|nr:thioredoxin family protein [Bacillota bacterium]